MNTSIINPTVADFSNYLTISSDQISLEDLNQIRNQLQRAIAARTPLNNVQILDIWKLGTHGRTVEYKVNADMGVMTCIATNEYDIPYYVSIPFELPFPIYKKDKNEVNQNKKAVKMARQKLAGKMLILLVV